MLNRKLPLPSYLPAILLKWTIWDKHFLKEKLIFACLMAFVMISCTTLSSNYKNPVEEAATNKNQYAQVTFYNNTNLLLYPSSSLIGIEIAIDGMRVARPNRGQYIDVYVKKGRHNLLLTHWDVFRFTDNYEIELTNDEYIIELYCRPFSTPYEIKNELSQDFNEDYERGTYTY